MAAPLQQPFSAAAGGRRPEPSVDPSCRACRALQPSCGTCGGGWAAAPCRATASRRCCGRAGGRRVCRGGTCLEATAEPGGSLCTLGPPCACPLRCTRVPALLATPLCSPAPAPAPLCLPRSVAVCPGGVKECIYMERQPGRECAYLRKRHGFVRRAGPGEAAATSALLPRCVAASSALAPPAAAPAAAAALAPRAAFPPACCLPAQCSPACKLGPGRLPSRLLRTLAMQAGAGGWRAPGAGIRLWTGGRAMVCA